MGLGSGSGALSSMSTFTVMRRLMGNRNEVADSGWYEFGSVPPDTYTAVIAEPLLRGQRKVCIRFWRGRGPAAAGANSAKPWRAAW